MRYAPPLVAAVEAILGPKTVVPVLQEPPGFDEEPDELLATEDVDVGEKPRRSSARAPADGERAIGADIGATYPGWRRAGARPVELACR